MCRCCDSTQTRGLSFQATLHFSNHPFNRKRTRTGRFFCQLRVHDHLRLEIFLTIFVQRQLVQSNNFLLNHRHAFHTYLHTHPPTTHSTHSAAHLLQPARVGKRAHPWSRSQISKTLPHDTQTHHAIMDLPDYNSSPRNSILSPGLTHRASKTPRSSGLGEETTSHFQFNEFAFDVSRIASHACHMFSFP